MNRKNFRKVLFLCGVLGCSALSAENYTRVGTGNWSDAAWTVNGTADQSWVDGNQAGITVAADNAFTLDAAASVTGIAFTGLNSSESAAFSGAKTLTFTGDAQTFEVADGTLNFANQLAGTAILKTGAGTLNITQIQTAFDGITVQEGTLQLSVGEFGTPCMSSAPVTILAGAKLLVSHNFGIGSGMLTADGGNVHLTGTQQYLNHMTLKNGATVTAVNGTSGGNDDNSFRVGYNYAGVSDATLYVTGTSASAISAGITMVRGSGSSDNYTVTVDSTGDESGVDLTISGKIFDYSGLSGLVLKKAGAGVLKLSSNASTWAGGINLTAGTIQLAADNAAGKGAISTSNGTSIVLAEGISANVQNLSGNASLSALGTGANINVGVGVTSADVSASFGGSIGSTVQLTKVGAGSFEITALQSNGFAGLVVDQGTLSLSGDNKYGSAALKNTPITVNTSGKLILATSFAVSGSPITLDGGSIHIAAEQMYLNQLTLKNGARITAQSNSNDHADGNSFRVGNNYGTGTNPVLVVSGTSGSFIDADIVLTTHGSSVFNVTVNSTGDTTGVDLTISGQLRDYDNSTSVSIPFKKMGAGVLRLTNGTNKWTTGMEVTAGTVQISATQALGYGQLNLSDASSALQLLSTANGGVGTYNLKQLTGLGTVSVLGDAATLKVGSVTNASSQVLSGDSTFSGTFSSAVSLEKTGTGTLTLEKSGGNGTIAGVSVTEGTLRLAGSGLAPTGSRYGYFGSTTIEVSGTGTLRAESWNIQNTPVHVTGENAELYIAGANYANRVTLTDGADVSGTEFRMGWWTSDSPILTVDGTGTGSVISNNIFMLLKNGSSITELDLTVEDTGAMTAGNADLTITSKITDHSGYEGLKIVKSGAGTLKITNTQNNWAGGMKIVDGLVILSAGAAGTGTYTVEAGGALAPAPASDETYVSLSGAAFVEGSNLELLIDSPTEFSRFVLDTVPTYDINNGFIELVVAEDANLGSSETFKVSNAYPGGSAENLDLESWLGSDFRYEWNLNWDAVSSALLLSRDANAIPEPAAWVLLILGVLGVGVVRKSGKKEKF